MVSRAAISFVFSLVSVGVFAACGASGTAGGGSAEVDGGQGATTVPSIPTPEAGPAVCGDGQCSSGETFETCSLDCGECPACSLAPSCPEAVGLPVSPSPRLDLDIGESVDAGPDASFPYPLPGTDGCQDAQLSLRIAQITPYEGVGQIYCIIS